MASSINTRFTIDISGQPDQFAQPFVPTFMELAQDPLRAQVVIPLNSTATIWSGAPPFATLDFAAFMADRDMTLQFAVDGGGADDFTLFIPGGGFPVVVYGPAVGSEITSITATNLDTVTDGLVTLLIAQAA